MKFSHSLPSAFYKGKLVLPSVYWKGNRKEMDGHAENGLLHLECKVSVTESDNVEDIGKSMELLTVERESGKAADESLGMLTTHLGNREEQVCGSDGKLDESWLCAICHEKIKDEEMAQIRGCEHVYCVTCILHWASYKNQPWCPQCRLPFSFLYVYRALDGSISDYMFEESVCLLLRAFWYEPLTFPEPEEQEDFQDDYDVYEEEPYYISNVRLGNRRWGDSGYVRGGRREARPVGVRQVAAAVAESSSSGSSSRQAKGKEPAKEATGRRARRAQKREQFDKMVAGKQRHGEAKHASYAK